MATSTTFDSLCVRQIQEAQQALLISQLIFAGIILIILSFVQRRKKLCHSCLWGFPGIPVPLDFLISPRYRFVYIIVFGVMASSLVSVFQTINTPSGLDFYAGIVYRTLVTPVVLVLILSLTFFPLFACVSSAIPLLGHTLGFIYSLYWFGTLVASLTFNFSLSICSDVLTAPVLVVLNVASIAPVLASAILIIIWYGFKMVQGFLQLAGIPRGRVFKTQQFVCCGNTTNLRATDPPHSEVKSYHLLYVKSLLVRCSKEPALKGRGEQLLQRVREFVFPYRRDFRLPLPFVGAVFAMSMLLYQLTIITFILGVGAATDLPPLFNNFLKPIFAVIENATRGAQFENGTDGTVVLRALSGVSETLGVFLVGIPAFMVISPLLALIFCFCLLINMVATVSKHLKRVAKEGFKENLPSPARRVTASWKYVGYLIGFFVLAWLIYFLIIFLILIAVAVLYLAFKYLTEYAAQALMYILVPLLWSQVVLLLQSLVCWLVFFDDKKGKFIAIKNSRLFNWLAYILFFYNGIAGFISAILRTLMSSLFSLLLLFRLDQVVLLKGFEQFDFAHSAYLGFIYLYSTYNNAVVQVFMHLMVKSTHTHSEASTDLETAPFPEDKPSGRGSRRARNRWLVAYTLVRNPSLTKYTASSLSAESAKESLSDSGSLSKSTDPQVKYQAPPVVLTSSDELTTM